MSRPERLEKALARVAREQGTDQERLRRWVSFLALCGALDRALQEDRLDAYHLKGGVALELRFAELARATKDLDLGLRGTRTSRLPALEDALAGGFDQFTFRLKAPAREMDQADTVRVSVAIQYKSRSWQTIDVDLGPASVRRVDVIEPKVRGLETIGIPVPSGVRCLSLADQVAQKLHACTGPSSAGRARDVLDILLMEQLGQLDYREVTETARQVFAERGTHAFPPVFNMPEEWQPELEALSEELGFSMTTAAEIEQRFLVFIGRLVQ